MTNSPTKADQFGVLTNSNQVTLKRRIERINESIERVNRILFTGAALHEADLLCLEIDSRRLADYCRFITMRDTKQGGERRLESMECRP